MDPEQQTQLQQWVAEQVEAVVQQRMSAAVGTLQQQNNTILTQLNHLLQNTQNPPTPSPKNPKEAPITPFDGNPDHWDSFLTQILLRISNHSAYFTTEQSKAVYLLQWMQGLSAEWAASYLTQLQKQITEPTFAIATELSDFKLMVKTATTAWGIYDKKGRAEDELQRLTQWKTKTGTVSEYRSQFQKFAQVTGWDDAALKSLFYKGLKSDIKDGLLSMPKSQTLDDLIQNSLEFERRLLERKAEKSRTNNTFSLMRSNPRSSFSAHDPNTMEIDAARLSPQERQRHMQSGLCFICHKQGHVARNCPDKKQETSRSYAASSASTPAWDPKEFEKEVEKRVAAALKAKEQGFQEGHN